MSFVEHDGDERVATRDRMGVGIEFQRRQLFVPARLARPTSRSAEVDLAMGNIGERIDGQILTGERGSPERLVEVLSGLNAADVIQTASKILMVMESLPTKGIREAQGDFVELFPAGRMSIMKPLRSGLSVLEK